MDIEVIKTKLRHQTPEQYKDLPSFIFKNASEENIVIGNVIDRDNKGSYLFQITIFSRENTFPIALAWWKRSDVVILLNDKPETASVTDDMTIMAVGCPTANETGEVYLIDFNKKFKTIILNNYIVNKQLLPKSGQFGKGVKMTSNDTINVLGIMHSWTCTITDKGRLAVSRQHYPNGLVV